MLELYFLLHFSLKFFVLEAVWSSYVKRITCQCLGVYSSVCYSEIGYSVCVTAFNKMSFHLVSLRLCFCANPLSVELLVNLDAMDNV